MAREEQGIVMLNMGHLGMAALLLLLVMAVSLRLGLGLQRRIAVAATRCFLQLTVLCGFVLEPMFRRNDLFVVLPYLGLITFLASREASSRLKYTYSGIRRDYVIAFALGCGFVICFAIALVLQLTPWWDAKYAVPVSGMIIGNVLTATALCTNVFLTELAEGTDRIDLYLCRGASWREAVLPAARNALTSALTPTLNSMGVMGLVMMPGMMTGQMLGGMPPIQAGAYQVMIMYLVTCAGCLTSLLILGLTSFALFDLKEHRLLRDRIVKRQGAKVDILTALCRFLYGICCEWLLSSAKGRGSYASVASEAAGPPGDKTAAPSSGGRTLPPLALVDASEAERLARYAGAPLVLEARNVTCLRTNLNFSLALRRGSRTALTGPTGVGKSQLLKTIARTVQAGPLAGRDPSKSAPYDKEANVLLLNGAAINAPAWRANVAYCSQDRPTLSSTPMDLFDTARTFAGQTDRDAARRGPAVYAEQFDLDLAKLDEPWATLSGGEAQRASLAVALALQPQVLLLDEPTAACDEATARKIEGVIIETQLTVLLVTHSEAQAHRLCDAHLHIQPSATADLV